MRAIRRQRRTGLAPVDDAWAIGRKGGAILHAARGPGGKHFKTLCRGELPVLAFRRDLPAVALAYRLPDARPDDPPADRDARGRALLHHQPDDRAADPPRSA